MNITEKLWWNKTWNSVLVRLGIKKIPGVANSLGDKLYAAELLGATTADMTLYVDAATGNDNNDGTVGSPLKTIMAAVGRVPQMIKHNVTINVAAGTYAETLRLPAFQTLVKDKAVTIKGVWTAFTPATGDATSTFTSNDSLFTFTLAGGAWTSDDLRGRFVKITSGAKSGNYYPVSSNTASTVTIGGSVSAIGNASFEFANPGTIITNGSGEALSTVTAGLKTSVPNSTNPNIRFSVLDITSANSWSSLTTAVNCRFLATSSVLMGNPTAAANYLLNCYVGTSSTSANAVQSYGGTYLYFGDSVIDNTSVANGGAGISIQMLGTVTLNNTIIQHFKGSSGSGVTVSNFGGSLQFSGNVLINDCKYGLRITAPFQLTYNGLTSPTLDISNCTSHGVYVVETYSSQIRLSCYNLRITACGGDGAYLSGNGNLFAPNGICSITGCAGFGIRIPAGNTNTHTNVCIVAGMTMNTNTAGDLTLDGTTPITIAELRAAPQKTLVDVNRLNRLAAD